MKELIKKSSTLLLFFTILIFSPLLAVEKKVRVTVERAPVYAEADTDSYRIEIVRKGTILTIFDSGETMVTWYYVSYRSKRWNSQVTGFIQASMVEEVSDKPIPEKVPEKREVKEEKPLKISPFPQRIFAAFQVSATKKNPRVFMSTLQREQWEESVGISSVLVSKSYALPESRWKEKPRVFLSIDTKQERQPPEVLVIRPETEEKKEETKKDEAIKTKPEKEQVVPQITPKKPPRPKKPKLPGEKSLFTLGAGYGPSGGSGLGGFVQFNTQKGFSFHLGAGLYPTTYFYSEHEWAKNQVLFSAGVKYYLPFKTDWIRTYLDLQYGGISVEAVRLVTGIWYYQYTYENIQKTLYGPSLLAGIELRFGNIGLNGAIGLSYNTTEWDYWEKDYFLTADVGVLIYLF